MHMKLEDKEAMEESKIDGFYMGSDQIYQQMSEHLARSRRIKPCSCKSKAKRLKEAMEAERHRIPEEMEELGMVIDSHSLDLILHTPALHGLFISAFNLCSGIVCCRATPKQKAGVVNLVKKAKHYYSSEGKKVKISALAIGDGGNDVNMIQVADIGIGIYGKEGNEAANSADYAIGEFKILRRLLLHHGRFISMRFGFFMYFFFYKNFIYTMTQLYFSFYSGFSGVTHWESLYANLYNVVTGFPVGTMAVVEEDIDLENPKYAMFMPYLFRRTRDDGEAFSYFRFFWWFFYGMICALINFLVCAYGTSSLYADVSTGQVSLSFPQDYSMWGRSMIAYANLMTVNTVLILHEARYHHWFMWLGLV